MAVRDLSAVEANTLRAVVALEQHPSFGQKRVGAMADGVAGWLSSNGHESSLEVSKETARARLNRLAAAGLVKSRPESGRRVSYITLGAGRKALERADRAVV